jgi:cytoskeletal protein RodZ
MDVGTTLRTARERRDLTLTQLATTTKIPIAQLRAIEDNAFDRVPRGIFIRGFIRAYAREVGLDAEEVIAQFRSETAETIPPAPGTQREGVIQEEIEPLHIDLDGSGSRPGWGYALIVAALVVGFVSSNRSGASEQPSPESAIGETAATDAATAPLKAVATSGRGLSLEIHARGECWVKAVVDGRTVVARLLQPGERVTTDAQHDVVLRVGDPAALTYSINGQPGGPLGSARIPVTVRFTSDGRQDNPTS